MCKTDQNASTITPWGGNTFEKVKVHPPLPLLLQIKRRLSQQHPVSSPKPKGERKLSFNSTIKMTVRSFLFLPSSVTEKAAARAITTCANAADCD